MKKIGFYIAKFIELYLKPSAIRNSQIDKNAKICGGVVINNSKIGRYTYIGNNSRINNCEIGRFCSIAGSVVIGGGSHPIDWVSTSPLFHSKNNIFNKSFSDNYYNPYSDTYIGNDVWIASNVLIKSGVRIGDGVVIGMGSVVTKDIPDFEIWAGNPAKYVRSRFDKVTIEKLQEIKWWNWDEPVLRNFGESFNNIEKFLALQKGNNNENQCGKNNK